MAKPSWLSVTPTSGSGNGSISNTGTVHTGRVKRTGTITVQGGGVTGASTYTVEQTPLIEFASYTEGTTISAPKTGGVLTIVGKTNSSKLTFSLGTGGDIILTLPSNYLVNGTSTTNAAIITGDPGAVSEVPFSIEFTIPANVTLAEKTKNIIVTTAGGQTAQITIEQAAGEASLSVSPTTIILTQAGTAVTVNVTSNTTWTVS